MVNREDLATLQRLQEEFSAELATLRGRVDALEARTAELEANQFSTTTTLSGEIVVAAADVFGDERAVRSGEAEGSRGDLDINTILADRARLSFNTSFTGKDLLRTRLQARNITPFTRTGTPGASGDTGTAMTRLSFDGSDSNDVAIDDFFYRFPVVTLLKSKLTLPTLTSLKICTLSTPCLKAVVTEPFLTLDALTRFIASRVLWVPL
ncbi:MAG: hypothetical protein CLLPBCKN_007331 [Chroococcidiopsis cubana SAG 39.79]|nr:hypothetical protein [Chroococcidiopsis cubana SAG 39.79]